MMKSKSLKKKAISMLLCFMVVFAYSAGFNDLFLVNAEGNTVSDSENGVTVTPDHTSGEPSEENKPGMELSGDDTENREPIVISSWKWVDDSEILTYDKKAKIWWVSPAADEENPVTAELLKEYLPKSIEAVLADGTEKSVEITWDFGEIGDGVTAGEYTFTASLPEGYALTDDVEALVAVVRIDSSALLDASYSAGGLTITADDGQELTSGTTNDSEVYLSGNVIYINTNRALTLAGTSTTHTLAIAQGVKANLTLDNVSIKNAAASPINLIPNTVADQTTLYLTLKDGSSNTMDPLTGTNNAGIHVSYGATLTIDDSVKNPVAVYGGRLTKDCTINGEAAKKDDPAWLMDSKNPGSLTVYSGTSAACIGGNNRENSGKITVNGGNIVVNAYKNGGSDSAGAGIGGGDYGGAGCLLDGGGVVINGGIIDATASYHGAGIGAGWHANIVGTGHSGNKPGDITINGGYITATGKDHGNAFGGACGSADNIGHGDASTPHEIVITGGTLLPKSNNNGTQYDVGAVGGKVIVTGGSFCPAANSGTATKYSIQGASVISSDGTSLTMVKVDLSSYAYEDKDGVSHTLQPGDYLHSYSVAVDGVPVSPEYGLAMKLDSTKQLYFWLPTSAIGKTVAISNLKLLAADGTLIDTEYPFTNLVPVPGNPSETKRYVTFTVDTDEFSAELKKQLNKRYDGLTFNWDQLKEEIAKQEITVPQPHGGKISKVEEMEPSAVRLTGADGKPTGEGSSDAGIKNAGGYSITVNYMEYAKDADFSKTFWGHQTSLSASITPADTRLVDVTYKPTMEEVTDADGKKAMKLTQMDFTATVLPKKGEATTCEAPDGFIQFYINGVKVGNLVSLNDSKTRSAGTVETGTTDGYNSKTVTKSVSFRTTTPPVPEAGEFVVEAKYYGGTNYTGSEAQATKVEDDTTKFDPDKDFPYIAPPTPVLKPAGSDGEINPDDPDQVIPGQKLPPVEVERIDPPGGATADENNYRLHGIYRDSVSQKTEKGVADVSYFETLLNTRYAFVDKAGHPLLGADKQPLKIKTDDIVITDATGEPIDEIDLSEKGKYLITAEVEDANGNKTTIELTFNLRSPVLIDPDINKDTNGDGIPDINIDTDDDGIPDINIDTDGDDKPDINIDTDGDDKPDVDIDTDGDGKPDINKDTDGDGKPDVDIDTDGDGKPDVNVDTNGDGKPDINKDTDGDGKPDVDIDTDGDGKPDINKDTDGDGKPDLDIDTNGDGKPDVNVDTNGDGKPDINKDTDGDGKPDVDIDTNGEGKPDVNVDTNGDGKPDINVDTNGDGKPDINIDTDGDGKPDINIDTDGDGIPDLNVDTDGDGKPDTNIDTDGDGKPDKNIKDPSEIKDILNENEPADTDELPWWIPKTGDTANMLTWLVVLGAAVLGLCGTVYGIRKKRS
ncbi:MAG: LPXTG cell wall anchor domain-containing protein [Emergencia sp.]|nr:LPXTG cell wall anchor domain-containing protein [Emergencia sp.]